MMNEFFSRKKYLFVSVILAAGFLVFPVGAKAATSIYFDLEKSTIYEGDIFLIDLKVSTPDKSINVVDGSILYDDNKLEIIEISTGGSLLSLWPTPPTFDNDKGILNFVGGITGGFQGEDGEVLKIVFHAKNDGEVTLDYLDGFSIFLHDGQGAQINPGLKPLALNILRKPPEIPTSDDWQDLIEKDKTPPEILEIVLGKDAYVFENQYFINFFATDTESGVDYYEVKEGERDFVRSKSPYLLKDQSLNSLIQVKAVDKAGNQTIEEFKPSAKSGQLNINTLIIILILLAAIYLIWKIVKSKAETLQSGIINEKTENEAIEENNKPDEEAKE